MTLNKAPFGQQNRFQFQLETGETVPNRETSKRFYLQRFWFFSQRERNGLGLVSQVSDFLSHMHQQSVAFRFLLAHKKDQDFLKHILIYIIFLQKKNLYLGNRIQSYSQTVSQSDSDSPPETFLRRIWNRNVYKRIQSPTKRALSIIRFVMRYIFIYNILICCQNINIFYLYIWSNFGHLTVGLRQYLSVSFH